MADMSQEQETFWREALKSLRGPFPEVGLEAPKEEVIEPPKEEQKDTIDPNLVGNFSRLTMDVYFFMNPETQKYIMMQSQNMTDFGEKTLKEAVEMAKRRQKRNKG